MPESQAATMSKQKRDDKAVKIDRRLATKAKVIADTRGISAAEYLSELLRPLIERDWPRAMKKLDTSASRTEDE